MKNSKVDKVVLKIYDKKDGSEKRTHNCDLCQAYKREMAKGDTDAFNFYKLHINRMVKKYRGITIILDAKQAFDALPGAKPKRK